MISTEHGLFCWGGYGRVWHHFLPHYWGANSAWLDTRELPPHRRPTCIVEDGDCAGIRRKPAPAVHDDALGIDLAGTGFAAKLLHRLMEADTAGDFEVVAYAQRAALSPSGLLATRGRLHPAGA